MALEASITASCWSPIRLQTGLAGLTRLEEGLQLFERLQAVPFGLLRHAILAGLSQPAT